MLPIPVNVPWKWIALGVGTLAFVGGVWWKIIDYGNDNYAQGRADLLAQQVKAALSAEEQQREVTVQVVTKYVDRIRIVREKGDVIIREVPVYVTAEDDDACTINSGFVRLWNDANVGQVSEPSAGADAAPSGVRLSEVGTQKAIEAKLCRATTQQLVSLQEWVREQQALSEAQR